MKFHLLLKSLKYVGFASIFRNPFWIHNLKWQRIVIVILIGGAGATVIEFWHLSQANWAYAKTMPTIPVINVGISAVLQFMILPVLVYFLSVYCLKVIKKITDDTIMKLLQFLFVRAIFCTLVTSVHGLLHPNLLMG